MAVDTLIPSRSKKAVVFLTQGDLGKYAFESYNLNQTIQYMVNNQITFYPVYVDDAAANPELEFISQRTGGGSYFLFNPAGIGDIIHNLELRYTPPYLLQYESHADPEFGEKYISVSLSTFFNQKSGRDESGYYAPLN